MQTVIWSHPYREARALASPTIATNLYQVGINGRGYVLDLASDEFLWQSIEYMRPQQDNSEKTGEGTLSNVDLWRRSFRSWHLGAGQSRGDEEDSNPWRFESSKGVNVWTRWQVSLLNETALGNAGSETPNALVVADGRALHQAGTTIGVSDNGIDWEELAVLTDTPTSQIVSDGSLTYVALEGGTIAQVTSVGVESTAFTLADCYLLGFSKGRLWGAVDSSLWYMTPGDAPVEHVVVPWTGWLWTAISEGSRATYAAGYLGDKSAIYRIPIKDDGTGLDAAVVAASLPDGEIVHSLVSYLGYIMIGTSLGVRFAVADTNGDLSYGGLIETDLPVRCFEPQDRYVWFGWSNYDDTHTGLGRVDLSQFTSDLTPAYASDLMYLGEGEIMSIITLDDRLIFAVESEGAVAKADELVATGVITTSQITYDLDDDKIMALLDMRHDALDGTISVALSVDDTGYGFVAEASQAGSTSPGSSLAINAVTGHRFQFQITLSTNEDGLGPHLHTLLALAHPVPSRGEQFFLPLQISEQVEVDGQYIPFDPLEELQALRRLVKLGAPVTLQIGAEAFNVFPANYRWVPYRQTREKDGWSGTCIMELREVTQ